MKSILTVLLSLFLVSCNEQEQRARDQEEYSNDGRLDEIEAAFSKLEFYCFILEQDLGMWRVTNPTNESVKISIEALVGAHNYKLYDDEDVEVKLISVSDRKYSEDEYLSIGPQSEVKLFFVLPQCFDISSRTTYLELRSVYKNVPSIYFRYKGGTIYNTTMSRAEARKHALKTDYEDEQERLDEEMGE